MQLLPNSILSDMLPHTVVCKDSRLLWLRIFHIEPLAADTEFTEHTNEWKTQNLNMFILPPLFQLASLSEAPVLGSREEINAGTWGKNSRKKSVQLKCSACSFQAKRKSITSDCTACTVICFYMSLALTMKYTVLL